MGRRHTGDCLERKDRVDLEEDEGPTKERLGRCMTQLMSQSRNKNLEMEKKGRSGVGDSGVAFSLSV